ncbi:type II toxin-antitoxin system RelE/ParE family toxin [Leminorella grimontii]|uniref:type II toxin-antitoxin system RelE/ParE family toxin n=1 Tax=Leminorella grimontii TaxID=82981 RepID=UPI00321FA8D9
MMYKLSHLAAIDFASIYEYTLTKFGALQADNYTEALEITLTSIVQSPFIGRTYPEINEDVRRLDYRQRRILPATRERRFYTTYPASADGATAPLFRRVTV